MYITHIHTKTWGNKIKKRPSVSPHSLKAELVDTSGEVRKYQVAELWKLLKELWRLSKFKEVMTQKFMELFYKMASVNMGETNKKSEELNKVQYMNDKFTKEIETMKRY